MMRDEKTKMAIEVNKDGNGAYYAIVPEGQAEAVLVLLNDNGFRAYVDGDVLKPDPSDSKKDIVQLTLTTVDDSNAQAVRDLLLKEGSSVKNPDEPA